MIISPENYEVLAPHGVPVKYNGPPDDSLGLSGEFDEFYDPFSSSPDIGSDAELGGVSSPIATYDADDQTDADVVNLTGMSESPMVAIDETSELSSNANGSGQAPQQVASIAPDHTATMEVSDLQHGIASRGTTLTTQVQAPLPASPGAPVILTQTGQSGISFHANMVLFFILGSLLGLYLLSEFEDA